ncbi:MAG TPA: hypothetical protein VM120_11195 [Bryobacteraceae bacterium]|nr:hypothetical protein [Bryobacteraceae bacterium]
MRKLLLFLLPALLLAANVKLYLKDGEYHLVTEYKVENGRVRFYSVERSDWEEIPVELADLKRTQKEIADRAAAGKEQAKLINEEEKAERELRREVARVPEGNGVYFVDGGSMRPLKLGETTINTNKRRQVWQVLSPIPMITGKATLELDGLSSAFVVSHNLPEFYFRLTTDERFGMVKLSTLKTNRVVEKITIIPVSKEMVEERDTVEVFRRQAGDGLYKVWPVQPLEPGEYALIQFTEGKVNPQVWDFSYKPAK